MVKKTILITQARLGSTRLPKKVLLKIFNKTLLQIHIDRIKQAKHIDKIFVATTTNAEDKKIIELSKNLNINYFCGSENDVLDRYYKAASKEKPYFVVRVTSDCPLIDPKLIDEIVTYAKKKDYDYYSNTLEELYPDGQDIEVFKFSALENAWINASLKSDREHVTSFIKKNSSFMNKNMFTSSNHYPDKNYNNVRLTVDEKEDFIVIKKIISNLGFEENWKTYVNFYLKNTHINTLNKKIIRNEGYINSVKNEKNRSTSL